MTAEVSDQLAWNADYIAGLMLRKKILDRTDLAKRLDIPYSTICVHFNWNWTGQVNLRVLLAMSRTFNRTPGAFIEDPR